MSDLENRVDKLEKLRSDTGEKPWLVVVDDDGQSEAALEKAKTDYKAKHPDWQELDFNVIYVSSEEAKELTECILSGEGT